MRRLTNIFFVVLLTQIHPSKPSVRNDNIRPTRSTIYREEFETYETVQREQQQRKDDGGARRTRMRYMEFAETEFSRRPSRLLPVQFIGTMDRQNQVLSARTLSQLIRQQIAAQNQMNQMAPRNSDYLRGSQSRVTELRQTPFRRWPTNSSVLTYEEKRRQWKMGLKRKKLEAKRPSQPVLISGGGQSSIQTDTEPESHYYVTYRPETRTYQVSRRPPSYHFTNPTTTTETSDKLTTTEMSTTQSLQPVTTTMEESGTSSTLAEEEQQPTVAAEVESESATTTAEETVTSSTHPLIVVVQHAEMVDDSLRSYEHEQQVVAMKKGHVSMEPAKQILFLDDYEQVQEDDDEESEVQQTTTTKVAESPIPTTMTTLGRTTSTATAPSSLLEGNERTDELGGKQKAIIREESDEDDDQALFFKTAGQRDRLKHDEEDPFRIMVHQTGQKRL